MKRDDFSYLCITIISVLLGNTFFVQNEIVVFLSPLIIFISLMVFQLINRLDFFFITLLSTGLNLGLNTIYSFDLMGIPLIYIALAPILLKFNYRLNRKIALFYLVWVIFGYLNRFDLKWFLIESFCYLFLFSVISLGDKNRDVFKKIINLYFFPIYPLIFIGLIISKILNIEGAVYDESGLLFSLILTSKAFNSKKVNFKYLVLFLLFLYIKSVFLYLGSFELIGIFTLILLSVNKFSKEFIIVSVIGFILFLIVEANFASLSNFNRHKIGQIMQLFTIKSINEISFSPLIRILEFASSWSDLWINKIYLFFGKGFGSFFTYDNFIISDFLDKSLLNTDSYSDNEIYLGKYKAAHNTLSYIVIKFGIIGYLILSYIIVKLFRKFKSTKDVLLLVILVYLLINFGWGLKNFLLTGLMLGLLNFNKENEENTYI